MASLHEYRRRAAIPLLGLGLAAYYLLVFVPLVRKAHDLDGPLQTRWKGLALSLGQTNALSLDFQQIAKQRREMRDGLNVLEVSKRKTMSRLELSPALKARLSAPFELLDFQNERSKQQDALASLAQQKQVKLDPTVLIGYPEYTMRVMQPELLWAALNMVNGVLETALHCKVSAINDLQVPLVGTNSPSTSANLAASEIPFMLELTGTASNLQQWLQTLPLRPDEVRASGIAEAPADRPPLFIEHLIITKQTPEKPDEVRMLVRLVGYILKE
jgi:hypothetical protein